MSLSNSAWRSSGKLFPFSHLQGESKRDLYKGYEVKWSKEQWEWGRRECGIKGKKGKKKKKGRGRKREDRKKGRGRKREDRKKGRKDDLSSSMQSDLPPSLQDDYRSSFLLLPFDLLLTLFLSAHCFFQLTVSFSLLCFFQLSLFSIRFPWNSAIINHWKIELTMQQCSMDLSSRESFALFLWLWEDRQMRTGRVRREREREQSVEMRGKREKGEKRERTKYGNKRKKRTCHQMSTSVWNEQAADNFIAVQIGCETTDRLLKLE